MNENNRFFNLADKSPVYQLFASIAIIVGIGSVLTIILSSVGSLLFDSNLKVLTIGPVNEKDIIFLRYLLIIQDVALLIVPAIIILSLMDSGLKSALSIFKIPGYKETALVIILILCLFPVTSFTGQINSSMHLPAWLSGLEQWMNEKEDDADRLINSLVVSDVFSIMMLNLFIIALLPAISEELIFRGVLQKIFYKLFKSGHIAIWVTATLFSAIHFQFFGFIPRLILGLVFGYLFYWSGNLVLPVLAHFANNAFPVVMAYFQGMEKLNSSPDISLWKQALAMPFFIAVILLILFYFRDKNRSGTIIDEIH